MFNTLKKIIKYPRLTQDYPNIKDSTSASFLGQTVIDPGKCTFCGECALHCPSQAIIFDKSARAIGIDYAKCIFCVLCEEICPVSAVQTTNNFELAESDKVKLNPHDKKTTIINEDNLPDTSYETICRDLQANIKKIFGRSLQIREVDAGSCNGCDYEINALNNPFNDLERLGISFVASPRHADMLLVTGTGTRNMQQALIKTYQATPDPKLVVAVGACACSGGIFRDTYATNNGIDSLVPVDVYIPGCPPRPQAIIYGILKAIDRV
ncbi:Ni,Fe-hydrogenase III small subunit [Desulfosporosinus acidiphilus SJ4]|uniref:Ni,Fe-hydrogenase III small subunit n=1 Tax=Desulfosporosinus acidiphilus (strain DSM 22704 / JCM 16185 / SJ4) TaxID=646529 RepID=I4D0S5_DESAJ|nr:NADH-quinone oxidoreductase subunit NuoB [Desulfosporosinus acidiphilus]AFM39399.1 Ni,Fe-hydrogenase III small subunit [Desulfosporosinus acidiphilus SJ4]